MVRRARGDASHDSDDEAPAALSMSSARDAALQQLEAEASSAANNRSARRQEKERLRKQRSIVSSELRSGADEFPTEILDQLPPAEQPSAPEERRAAREERSAPARARRQKKARAAASREQAGMPRVVRSNDNVEYAVLDSVGTGRAPVRQSVDKFVSEQMYGGRHKRGSALTLAGLKPGSGARFGAASNFTTAAAPPAADGPSRRQRKRAREAVEERSTSTSLLDRVAARLKPI